MVGTHHPDVAVHQEQGTIEGLHDKMEPLSRRASGFRNLSNFLKELDR
jgi:transposase